MEVDRRKYCRMIRRLEYKYTLKALGSEVFKAHMDPQVLAEALSSYGFKALRTFEIVCGAELHIQTTMLGQKFRWLIQVNEVQEERAIVYDVRAVEGSWLTLQLREMFLPRSGEVEVRYLAEYEAPLTLTPVVKRILLYLLRAKEDVIRRRFNQPTSEAKRRMPFTYPLYLFNSLQIIGLMAATGALILASSLTAPLSYLLALVSWLLYWAAPHCLAHYLVGRLLGIRFSHYFIGLSNLYRLNLKLPQRFKLSLFALGIKTDSISMLEAPAGAKAAMYAAGAVASMAAPYTTPIYLIRVGVFDEGVFLLLLSLLNTIFSLYFSFKAGDLRKARRALSKRRG